MRSSSFRLSLSGLALCAFAAILAGCNDPTADKPAAEVSEAIAIEAPPLADAEGNGEETLPAGIVYAFSNGNSGIDFEGYKVTGPHVGGFGIFEGTVTVPGGDLDQAKIAFEIDMTSTYSDNHDLTATLLGIDFFEAERYPTSTFTSTNIEAWPDGLSFDVTGNLELHGVTKGVTFPATISLNGTTLTAEAEFTIDRTDWDITYKGLADDLIRDKVLIIFEIEAEAQGG